MSALIVLPTFIIMHLKACYVYEFRRCFHSKQLAIEEFFTKPMIFIVNDARFILKID